MKKWLLVSLSFLSLHAFAQNRTMSIQHLQNANSYFSISVTDDGTLSGTYPGWCVDWNRLIQDNTPYPVKFYSSIRDNFPAGVVAHPENLDEMNWLLNKKFVGKTAPNGFGVYTSGDVQVAIWTLIDDNFQTDTVGPFSQARVDTLVELAMTKGSGYYPKCRELVGIILDPGEEQGTVIEVPKYRFVKCHVPDGDE